jgi:hypothetical protein
VLPKKESVGENIHGVYPPKKRFETKTVTVLTSQFRFAKTILVVPAAKNFPEGEIIEFGI